MNARGRRIALDEAAAGETLALDVCDAGGHTLLAAGTGLAAAAVAALRRRGVTHVHVVAEPPGAEELAARRAAAMQRLDHLFRRTQGNALMARLQDAVLAFRLEQLR
jgi:diaminopimelate epimerase